MGQALHCERVCGAVMKREVTALHATMSRSASDFPIVVDALCGDAPQHYQQSDFDIVPPVTSLLPWSS